MRARVPEVNFDTRIFNPAFLPFLNTQFETEIYVGGGGSGKSHFVVQKSIYNALKEKHYRQIFCRKTAESIRDSQFLMYKDTIRQMGLNSLFTIKESSMDIICSNGNMMLSYGLDDPAKLTSLASPTDVWIEEVLGSRDSKPVTMDDYDQLQIRLRAEPGQKLQTILSYNPVNEESWVKKRFHTDTMLTDRIEASKIPGTIIHWSTFADNQFIDREAYAAKLDRLAETNPNYYRIYRLGKWGREISGQEYYSKFRYEQHVVFTYNYTPGVAVHLTFDQNAIPYNTALMIQVTREGERYIVNVLNEFCIEPPHNSTAEVCEVIRTKHSEKLRSGVFLYGDASGRKTDTREKVSDYQIIERSLKEFLHNGSMRVCRSNPTHKTRSEFMNKMLAGHYPIEIRIHHECRNLIKDLETLKTDIDFGKLKETERNQATGKSYEKIGHTSDALDYFCTEAFKQFYVENNLNKIWRN